MTDMQDDERIAQLFQTHRHRGVLIYIWVLERIAERMDETDRCNLETSRQHWAKMLRTYWKDAEKILTRCEDLGLIFLASSEHLVNISCPKLLEIRARKKPIGGKLRTLDTDTDTDTDTDKERIVLRADKIQLSQRGEFSNLTEEKKEFWKKAYPALNIDAEIKKAAVWLMANPKNKKTNYDRFLVNWFSRSQDRAPRSIGTISTAPSKGRFD